MESSHSNDQDLYEKLLNNESNIPIVNVNFAEISSHFINDKNLS